MGGWTPQTPLWLRHWPGVKVNGAYYCDVLLLKQLPPDISQAAGDFCFPVSLHHQISVL